MGLTHGAGPGTPRLQAGLIAAGPPSSHTLGLPERLWVNHSSTRPPNPPLLNVHTLLPSSLPHGVPTRVSCHVKAASPGEGVTLSNTESLVQGLLTREPCTDQSCLTLCLQVYLLENGPSIHRLLREPKSQNRGFRESQSRRVCKK